MGIGSVITGELVGENQLFAGVPAKPVKQLAEEDRFLIERKTQPETFPTMFKTVSVESQ